jgi:uncharacterized repeat protein (TIGR01451 family)
MKSFLHHLQSLSRCDTPLDRINVDLGSRQQRHRRFWAVPATIVFLGSNLPLLLLNPRSALADQPNVCATPGKDGSPTISGIVNSYYPGTSANVAVGATSVPVGAINSKGNQTAIAKGDLILIIQMQDADINSTDSDAYGNGVGGDAPANTGIAPSPTGASGYTSLNNAGRYEYAVAAGPISGGAIPIQAGTTYSYRTQAGTTSFGQRTYQVVRIPQYLDLTISGTLTTAAQWNGNSGGIVALDVAKQLTFTAGSVIDVNGLGFRGGGSNPNPYTGGSTSPSPYRSVSAGVGQGLDGPKGEGIAGTPRFVATQPFGFFNVRASNSTTDLVTSNYPNGDEGRGAPGNAGGGGNEHNSGGGGGANGGDGGMGGRSFNGFGGSQPRFDTFVGGFGGKAIPADPKRLILGGGGGAGDTNDQTRPSGAGGGGGGLVIIRAGTVTGTGTISARGGDGIDSVTGTTPDAGGGGGAGGTVLIAATGSTASVSVIATGGAGGDLAENNTNELDGPGAGGGGGAVYTSGGGTPTVTSGAAGIITGGNLRNNTPNGATPGIVGTSGTVSLSTDLPTSISGSNPICQNQPPTTNDLSTPPQPNPNGTSTVTVPTLAGNDPEDGVLGAGKSFRITKLPTNGILYYPNASGVPTAVTLGQLIANYDPTKLTIDPNDGAITVTFEYAAIDSGGKEDATPATVTMPFTVSPNLLLVKRITGINGNSTQNPNDGTPLNVFVDDMTSPKKLEDNNPNWVAGSLKGAIDGGKVRAGDEIEYTIYFLSAGNAPVKNLNFCDLVPSNTTFLPNSFTVGNGIQLSVGSTLTTLSNVPDGDRGEFFVPNSTPPINCSGANTNGAVMVKVVDGVLTLPNATSPGTPNNSYGFVRFRAKTK